jgi:hypothetical protein
MPLEKVRKVVKIGRVLRMRFGIGMNTDHTLEEVGQQFSVTRERIRQIEAKALRMLKHPPRAQAAQLPRHGLADSLSPHEERAGRGKQRARFRAHFLDPYPSPSPVQGEGALPPTI